MNCLVFFYNKNTSRMLYLSGPLVCFEGLLSLYGHEVKMVNDMIVAIEDLRSVEFTLIPVEKRASRKAARCRRGDPAARVGGAGAPAGGGSVAPAGGGSVAPAGGGGGASCSHLQRVQLPPAPGDRLTQPPERNATHRLLAGI